MKPGYSQQYYILWFILCRLLWYVGFSCGGSKSMWEEINVSTKRCCEAARSECIFYDEYIRDKSNICFDSQQDAFEDPDDMNATNRNTVYECCNKAGWRGERKFAKFSYMTKQDKGCKWNVAKSFQTFQTICVFRIYQQRIWFRQLWEG